jgi:hypothetical protein
MYDKVCFQAHFPITYFTNGKRKPSPVASSGKICKVPDGGGKSSSYRNRCQVFCV